MFAERFSASPEHCDDTGRIKLSSLQYFMQVTACNDCDEYGNTTAALREDGVAFVITRISMDIYLDIREGDTIEIFTESDRTEGICWIREFLIATQNGFAARASTAWILLDLNKRTVVRRTELRHELPNLHLIPEGSPYIKRIFARDESPAPICEVSIQPGHIDVNGHVNNTYYQDFIHEALNKSYNARKIEHVQISYEHEALNGDILAISGIMEDRRARLRAVARGKVCFEADVAFAAEEA